MQLLERLEDRCLMTVYNPRPVPFAATPVEHNSSTALVAKFVPTSPLAQNSYSVEIDWNDGNGFSAAGVSFGQLAPNDTEFIPVAGVFPVFSVIASHTFGDQTDGAAVPFTIRVRDTFPNPNAPDFTYIQNSTAVADASLTSTFTPAAVIGTEGVSAFPTLLQFVDGNPTSTAGDFAATIDWGDGKPASAGAIIKNGATYNVSAAHGYATTGNYAIKVRVQSDGASELSAQTTATIANAALTAPAPVAINAVKNAPLVNVPLGTFTDANTLSTASGFTATVDFGDGSGASAAQVVLIGGSAAGNVYALYGSHTYASSGTFSVSATATEVVGGEDIVLNGQASVGNTAIAVSVFPIVATEDVATPAGTLIGSFVDANGGDPAANYAATIAWGDGTTAPGVATPSGGGTFLITSALAHTYATPGTFTVTVTVVNSDPVTAATSTGVGGNLAVVTPGVIPDAVPTGVAVPGFPIEGIPFIGTVAYFTDPEAAPATDYTAIIAWGDGTISAGTVVSNGGTGYIVTAVDPISGLGHTYQNTGSYTFSVTVTDPGGSSFTAFNVQTVADAALTAVGLTTAIPEYPAFSGVVATFTDANPFGQLSTYQAAINWGDGTITPGTIAPAPGGGYQVSATHLYPKFGTYLATITIKDNGSSTALAVTTFNVTDLPLAAGPAITIFGVEGRPITDTQVATFSDANLNGLAAEYSAAITWGDGTATTAGTVIPLGNGRFSVTGSHTYANARVDGGNGAFPVTVTITDLGGAQLIVTSTASVADVPIVIAGQLDPASDSGLSNQDGITNVARPNFFGTSEPFSTVRLFAGPAGTALSVVIGLGTADASGSWSITSDFLADGNYVVVARAVDVFGFTRAEGVVREGLSGGPLVIDTIGPKVTGVRFPRSKGAIRATMQDERSGLDPSSLANGANYSLTRRNRPAGALHVNSLPVTNGGGPTAPRTVSIIVNGGRSLRADRYVLTIRSGGVRDVAGNALDGEFHGSFPSGNNQSGGDFVASLNAVHHQVLPIRTTIGTASPNTLRGPRRKVVILPATEIPGRGIARNARLRARAIAQDQAIANLAMSPSASAPDKEWRGQGERRGGHTPSR